MIYPRSIRDCAVLLVNLIAWPVNKAIDSLDFSDIGDDEIPWERQGEIRAAAEREIADSL